jgi:hypothetical protein
MIVLLLLKRGIQEFLAEFCGCHYSWHPRLLCSRLSCCCLASYASNLWYCSC